MAAVGKFWHKTSTNLNTAATNAYAVARSQQMTWNTATGPDAGLGIRGEIRTVQIRVDTIAGAASVTFRICSDAAGDVVVVPDTTATLSTGVTTAASGCVTYNVGVAYANNAPAFWVFWRLNAGTANVRAIDLIWEE